MFIALGLLCSLHAERAVLQAELVGKRALRTDAHLLLGDAHETLPDKAEKMFFGILSTGIVGWTHRAITHIFVSLRILVQLCR